MEKKSELTRNRKFGFIRRELEKLYGKETAKRLIVLAQKHYDTCRELCQTASKGELQHVTGTILPTVAFYKALQETNPENALRNVHAVMICLCEKGGAVAGKLLKLPGMKSVFMWALPKMAVNMFGESCGFQYENYEAGPNLLKMDMTACPYCRYAALFGCPELMPTFCESDFATYGNLPGIQFVRTQTLGTGGSRCDFRFIRE